MPREVFFRAIAAFLGPDDGDGTRLAMYLAE
jgi:hypothetical protein